MIDVKHVTKLASLPLTNEEEKRFTDQLAETIKFIDHLKKIDVKDVAPTSQVTGKTNQFRPDEITPSLSQEQALKNAPKTYNGFFVTKIVWE